MCYTDPRGAKFMDHLRAHGTTKTWTWSAFREGATHLQGSYCRNLMEGAIYPGTKVRFAG